MLGLVMLMSQSLYPSGVVAEGCDYGESYAIQWGDTLALIARRVGTTFPALATLNGINNPNRIFVGQNITLPSSGECYPSNSEESMHIVKRGETLWRIASRYGISVHNLVVRNNLRNPGIIHVGQLISLPGRAASKSDSIFTQLRLSTEYPEQGRTLVLVLPFGPATSISGKFGGNDILFFRDGDNFLGFVGMDALTDPGVYQLMLEANDAKGDIHLYSHPLILRDGDYHYENIILSASATGLLSDPTVTANERQLLANMVAPVTATRYWDGVPFLRASVGRITSDFGTRRSYNGGGYNTYHGGVDFSAHSGTEIRAPASGRVTLAQPLHVRGNTTIIDHGLGLYSVLLHQDVIHVSVGDEVTAGQHIGEIGSTGLVTGPHLHWEVYLLGVKVDPMQWTQRMSHLRDMLWKDCIES